MMPDKVSVSPLLVKKVLLAPKVILPAKELVRSLSVPPLSVMALAPIVTPCRSKLAPLAMVTAPPLLLPRPALLVITKVPPLMVVVPV